MSKGIDVDEQANPNPFAQFGPFRRKLLRGDYGRRKTFLLHVLFPGLVYQFGVIPNIDHFLFFYVGSWVLLIYITHGIIGTWRAPSMDKPLDPETFILKIVLFFISIRVFMGFFVMTMVTVEWIQFLVQ